MKLRTLLLAMTLMGCGGGGDLTSLEGIYEIADWTENENSCDAPGVSILADQFQSSIYIETVEVFGVEFINAVPCENLEDCRAEVADETISLGGFAFEDGSDNAGWTGKGHFIGGSDSCSGEVFEDRLESIDAQTVQITRRAVVVENVPLDGDGFCDGDAAEEMAGNLPCSRLEQITATLTEVL